MGVTVALLSTGSNGGVAVAGTDTVLVGVGFVTVDATGEAKTPLTPSGETGTGVTRATLSVDVTSFSSSFESSLWVVVELLSLLAPLCIL